jgi:hypothetical protein
MFVVLREDAEDLDDARRAALAEIAVPLLGTLDTLIHAEARRRSVFRDMTSSANLTEVH